MLTAMLAMDVKAVYIDNPKSKTELEPEIELEQKKKNKNKIVTKAHIVKFAGRDWYIIGYNDLAEMTAYLRPHP
jgi:hypothetical protein